MLRELERNVYLRTLDVLWMEHIDSMQKLREAVALSGYGQRDPLIEYKQQAYRLFIELLSTIRSNSVNTLFKLEFRREIMQEVAPKQIKTPLRTNEQDIDEILSGSGAKTSGEAEIGRNEPCSCGSGKKYKKCHG